MAQPENQQETLKSIKAKLQEYDTITGRMVKLENEFRDLVGKMEDKHTKEVSQLKNEISQLRSKSGDPPNGVSMKRHMSNPQVPASNTAPNDPNRPSSPTNRYEKPARNMSFVPPPPPPPPEEPSNSNNTTKDNDNANKKSDADTVPAPVKPHFNLAAALPKINFTRPSSVDESKSGSREGKMDFGRAQTDRGPMTRATEGKSKSSKENLLAGIAPIQSGTQPANDPLNANGMVKKNNRKRNQTTC